MAGAAGKIWGFGIVGAGMGAFTHAANFLEMPNVTGVAIYGRQIAKATEFKEKWKMKRAYDDYDAFLADPELDIVVIVVPNGLHRDFTVRAAEAGKHVVLEKPLDITLAAGIEQVLACKANNVVMCGVYQMRFCKCAAKIKDAIDSGMLGDLLHIDVLDKEYRDESYYGTGGVAGDHEWTGKKALAGGGCLTTQATHVLDLMQWFMGGQCGRVKTVTANSRTAKHDIEVEDMVTAMMTWENGVTGNIIASTCIKPAFKHRVEIHGTKGTVMMNGEYDKIIFWDLDDDPEKIDLFPTLGVTDIVDPHFFPIERHRLNLDDAIAAIEGKHEPLVSGPEALKTELIRLAIYESSDQKRTLTLDYSDIDIDSGADGSVVKTWGQGIEPAVYLQQQIDELKRNTARL
eukprot:SAG22_NODE_992_length_6129_cov_5.002488_1_plen_402_part_00